MCCCHSCRYSSLVKSESNCSHHEQIAADGHGCGVWRNYLYDGVHMAEKSWSHPEDAHQTRADLGTGPGGTQSGTSPNLSGLLGRISKFTQILKPPRSKHCEICKCCVKVYDHHCPFLNNCIGAGNYFLYCILLVTASTCFGIVCFLGIKGRSDS